MTTQPKKKRREALDLNPLIVDLRESLDRLEKAYILGGDMYAAIIDLKLNFESLEDGVDKNEASE